MKRLLYCILFFLLLSCANKQEPQKALFRIGQFLTTTSDVEIIIYRNTSEVFSTVVDYGKITKYSSLDPTRYLIKVKNGDELVLEKEIGIGEGGKYTLSLVGSPVNGQSVNLQTVMDKLQHIVEGAEGTTENGYLPQLLVLNDFFSVEKGKAKLRFINLCPGSAPFRAIASGRSEDKEFASLKYAKISETATVGEGKTGVTLFYDAGPLPLEKDTIDLEKETMVTYFIAPSSPNSADRFSLIFSSDKMK
ncbi:DUF4397 domain-containing protein [Pareuzebyella sediminis]|uniref:DUF4397 domain-containing protein n=1 Tax=Pareuzebyella sediminis TaxID=2607998 RepID=UPI0011EDFBCA|nr:DUF4397 domain-containing protein [Pareuzebyella sediminis]